MISAGDFRNGLTFEMDGDPYQVIEFQHVKPGKGAAFVRAKVRNVLTGTITEDTFNPNERYPTAYIERSDMQYLYRDGNLFYFMNTETYENIPIEESVIGDALRFIRESDIVKVLLFKGNAFGVEPPMFVTLEVTETEPGIRGDTATNVMKPATLETGAEIRVPLFVNTGDKIVIDTRTGEYSERA